ncbi:MAG: peptidoglycan-binding protein [Clostridia bacterium]|nr:peptidoglycan-binding protein [Clostridia bacterium]
MRSTLFLVVSYTVLGDCMEVLRIGSSGPMVYLLQSVLKTLGFYQGAVDGLFGSGTYNAVKFFQSRFGLIADGIVGANTWNALMPYINGYTNYTVKRGDSIYKIAQKYSTTMNRIIAANPGINANLLNIGQKIIVPFGRIVRSDVPFSSDIVRMNLNALTKVYPFLTLGSMGESVRGKDLFYMRLGTGTQREVFYSAAIHANEWITAGVMLKFIENYSLAYVEYRRIGTIDIRNLFQTASIYIEPLCNPDGVDLVTGAIKLGSETYLSAQALANNYPNLPFPNGWKANIRGVDLNLQFPAGWEQAREIKFGQGYTKPGPRDYVGARPLNQPESLAMYEFTLAHDFRLILAYHTQGRVIYWQYQDYVPENSREIGELFARMTGYRLETTPFASGFAGYKDWFIQNYNRQGYTFEVGLGVNPLPLSQFNQIYRENEGVLVTAATV